MAENSGEKFVRAVGFWGLVAMTINAVIGSGVFLLPTETYKLLGPFSLWAPLIFAVPVFILVLCFAEAASHFTETGGPYLYVRTAFGEFLGFETGWMNWLARVTSLASLSNGFVVSLARLVPVLGTGLPRASVIIITLLLLGAIHFVGVKYGAASIYVFTLGKLIPLVGFIFIALIAMKHNPIPGSGTLPGGGTDWNGAALFMLFAYAGFENVAGPAGEYRNPRRDLPAALLTGILAIAVIYVLTQFGAMATLGDVSKTETPIADAAAAIIGTAGAVIVTIGALLSMAGTNSGTVFEGSRMLYAIFSERRWSWISTIHPRYRTPSVALMIHVAVALILSLAGGFATMAKLSAVARLATYLFTAAALPRLRKVGAGWNLPGAWTIPILGVLVSLLIVVTLDVPRLLIAAVAVIVGAVLYFASGAALAPEAKHE